MKEKSSIPAASLQDRRKFLTRISLALGGFAALVVSIPVVGALLAPLLQKAPSFWRPVGKLQDFPVGATILVHFENASPDPWAGLTAKTGAWLRRIDQQNFEAFALNCAHLGCPVSWIADAEIFLCPCHGGVYYKDGSVASGPPPTGLSRYHVRVRQGQVEIQTEPIPITTITAGLK